MHIIPALGRLTQEGHELEASLGYIGLKKNCGGMA
jgi:hypothetical protein